MIGLSSIQSMAQVAGGRVITGIAAGLIFAALSALLIRALRSSSTKFAVYFLTLLAIAVLPAASCFVSPASGVQSVPSLAVPGRWGIAIFGFWMLGAVVGLGRIALGLWRVRRIRRRCRELETGGHELLESNPGLRLNLAQLTSNRRVALCVSEDVSVPTAIGFFRPAILLPAWAITDLSASELESILLHELGHLRRWDDWTNLAQKVLQALLFFHPAVWWIDSRLALEREAACDDLVVAKTCDARGYAQCLVSVAEKSMGRRGFAVAVAAVSRVRETALRLTRILDQNRPAGTRVSKPVLATFAALTLALLVEMPHMPAIVMFSDAAPATLAHESSPVVSNHARSIPRVIPAAQIATGTSERLSQSILAKAELRTRDGSASRSSAETISAPTMRTVRLNRVETRKILKPLPTLIRASWNPDQAIPSQQGATQGQNIAPAVLLVTQTVSCDESGNCFVSVRTWQVLRVDQATHQAQNGNGSRSI